MTKNSVMIMTFVKKKLFSKYFFPGILPLDAEMSGLCDVVQVDEYNLGYFTDKPSLKA